jgi:hypothetical protein
MKNHDLHVYHDFSQIDGADPEHKIFRDELFLISGLRAKYPQCFLLTDGLYRFVGLWDTIEKLVECDSIPREELAAHPEIETFTSVFFGRDEEPARLTPLAKRTAGRRGRIEKIGRLDRSSEANIKDLKVEINKFDNDANLMPYSSPKRSLSSQFFNSIMKKTKN